MTGKNVATDRVNALKWFTLAAAGGSTYALAHIKTIEAGRGADDIAGAKTEASDFKTNGLIRT